MIILIGTNRDNGKIAEVGLYEDIEDARRYVNERLCAAILYSVWTPEAGSTIEAASVIGLTRGPHAPR